MIKDLIERNLISKKTNAVYDYEFIKALKNVPWAEWLDQPAPFQCLDQYVDTFSRWIVSSRHNTVKGLDRFSQRHLICGTTQTFDETYMKYANRRLRFFKGEYAYHRRVFKNWKFIEEEDLNENDFIIVSMPFCSTGKEPPSWNDIFDLALKLKVPVIVDCAYFGTCSGLHFDLTHPAIESVSFSLTKGLGLGDIRSGIRFSNIKDQNPICQQNDYNHSVMSAAKIGIYMMNLFSPDFIVDKYESSQKEICQKLGITATPCMHLALADGSLPDFIIDGTYYRLGIRELVKAKKQGKI